MATTPKTKPPSRKKLPQPARGAKRTRHTVSPRVQRPQAPEQPPEAFALDTPEGPDALAEALAEQYVENATGADDAAVERHEELTTEESGGPFVVTTGDVEYADDLDDTNPLDARREPLPEVSAAEGDGALKELEGRPPPGTGLKPPRKRRPTSAAR